VGAGAGAKIAFACDIVLAAKSAKFIQAFSTIGLIPDAGGSWSLARMPASTTTPPGTWCAISNRSARRWASTAGSCSGAAGARRCRCFMRRPIRNGWRI
ncbi:hypothetical protein HA397_26095, partial [Escherichia coli]|nr:hypothetical protein [Escherichia coli]